MKSVATTVLLALLTLAFPVSVYAEPQEIINVLKEDDSEPKGPVEPISKEECMRAMEMCPEVEAKECKASLEKNGCKFLPGQTFKHKTTTRILSETECIKAVEACPYYKWCKEGLQKQGCMLTPKDLNLPDKPVEEIAEYMRTTTLEAGFDPTPSNCAAIKQGCVEAIKEAGRESEIAICDKHARSLGCKG